MAVSYVAASSGNSGAATAASYATSLPTGWAADDVAVLTAHIGGTSLTIGTPAGWTAIPGPTWPVDQGSASRMFGWYRVLQGGDAAPTLTVSGSSTGGWTMTAYRDADTASPLGQVGTATASATSIGLAALTGVLAGSMLAAHVHARVASGTTPPAGLTQDGDYTEAADHGTSRNSGSAQNLRFTAAYRAIVGAGNISGDTVTVDGAVTSSLAALVVEIVAAEEEVEPPPEQEPVVDGAAATHEVRVDLWVDDVWTDITSDVRQSPGVRIERGRANEQAQSGPSRCDLVVNNRTGKYSPRNPSSTLYGKIVRNQPIRVAVEVLTDAFARTSASGWGDADTGQSWTALGGAATDYTVGSGVGVISLSAVDTVQQTYAAAVDRADCQITAYVHPGVVATGDTIQVSAILRRQDADNMVMAALVFGTDSTVTLLVVDRIAGVNTNGEFALDTLAYDADTELGIEFSAVGTALHARVWDVADPSTVITATSTNAGITAAGGAGIRAALGASNSNALPVDIEVSSVQVDDVRFCGEVLAWPPRWDKTGRDIWAPITATGITRRLGSAGAALRSPLYRAIVLRGLADSAGNQAGTLVDYWPCEDSSGSTQAAAALPGGRPLTASPEVSFGSDGPDGSESLPSVGASGAKLWGVPAAHSIPGDTNDSWWITVVFRAERSGSASLRVLEARAEGLATKWRVDLTESAATLTVIDPDDGTLGTASHAIDCLDGEWHHLTIEGVQTATPATSARLYVDDSAADLASIGTATLGRAWKITAGQVVAATGITSAYVGHLQLWTSTTAGGYVTNQAQIPDALAGHTGETAGTRMVRLCQEEGVVLALSGDPDETPRMGPQRVATLVDLLRDCETADGGLLAEARQVAGILYRTAGDLTNQTAAVTVDYEDSALLEVGDPTDDDLLVRNQVTASRTGGSSAVAEVTTGALSTLAPPDGVGVVAGSITAPVESDLQLPDIAGWAAHLGTWDELRIPGLTVELRRSPYTASQFLTSDAAGVDLGDVIEVQNPPSWVGPNTLSLMAQGTTEYLDEFRRTLGYNTAPAGPWDAGVWGSGSDPDDEASSPDHYDTAGAETAVEFVSGTDTTMTVLTTSGEVWTTDTDDLPLDIVSSGARLTVTAIASAETDAFGRTEASGWGTSESGLVWSVAGGSATDYSVSSGVGNHSLGTVNTSRKSFAGIGAGFDDCEIKVKVTIPVVALTDSIDVAIMFRYVNVQNYYHVVLHCHDTGLAEVRLRKLVGAVFTTLVISDHSMSYGAGDTFWLHASMIGSTLRGRAWNATGSEPPGWHAETTDTDLPTGGVGLRSNLQASNTNTLPVVIAWDDFEIVNPQSFTITQTPVNGVTKTIAAGSDVRHADPSFWAL